MTPLQYEVINEIERYYKKMGKWPTISLIHHITKFDKGTLSCAIKKCVERGELEYKSPYILGKTRYVGLPD